MAIQRCPECGGRLTTNYCSICMRKVPFAGARPRKYRDPWEYSSAHREEKNHKCITFDTPKTAGSGKILSKPKTAFSKPKSSPKSDPKKATVVAVVLALLSLIPTAFSLFEGIHVDNPTPEYNVEAFTPEADLPALRSTGIYNLGGIEIYADALGMYDDEPALSFLIENQSEQDIDVVIEKVAVNGFMLDYGMTAAVNAGESCQAFLSLYRHLLDEANIQQIAQVDLRLYIYDRDNYDVIYYDQKFTLQTEAAKTYVQPVDRSGLELYNDGSVSVLLRDMTLSGYGDGEIKVMVENLSGSDAMVYAGDLFLNGQKAEGYFGCSLMPGTCAISSVYLSDLESLDIEELAQLEEVTISMQVDYMDGWEILATYSEAVTFEPGAIK